MANPGILDLIGHHGPVPAEAQGRGIKIHVIIGYPGSSVSDLLIGGVRVQVPNDALRAAATLAQGHWQPEGRPATGVAGGMVEAIEAQGFERVNARAGGGQVLCKSGEHWRVEVRSYGADELPDPDDWEINVYSIAHPDDEPVVSSDCRGMSEFSEAFAMASRWLEFSAEGAPPSDPPSAGQRLVWAVEAAGRDLDEAGRRFGLHHVDSVEELGGVVEKLLDAVGRHHEALTVLRKEKAR